ncbi:biphenyl 2,3-dioxygenase beta subunit [Sphingomonas vulcanisoli]|uniref:Biphenyl 2,3-dioxygenase beta subunit n=1 Tax=Sphingomonas vulcanisoli TaxID=1658060 RepID=A0ABX0TUR2_9SPHN|nr:biphenyl 2,3-dioxygenase beta subunit [Sphingomonas vulcanisoli]
MERQFAVEQFYYNEAAMLDSRNYAEWFKLFAEDIHYWMPVRRTMTSNELAKEFTQPGSIAFFDDDYTALGARVRKLETGYAWAEDPPSRQRHIVTNVRVVRDDDDELEVESNFHLYRTRLNSEEDNWLGMRRDVLRKVDGSYKIANRKIFLDQTVVLSRNLSNFF